MRIYSNSVRRMDEDESLLKIMNYEVRQSNKQIAELYIRLDKIQEVADPVDRKTQKEELQNRIDLCQANLKYSQDARQTIMNARVQKLQLLHKKVIADSRLESVRSFISETI